MTDPHDPTRPVTTALHAAGALALSAVLLLLSLALYLYLPERQEVEGSRANRVGSQDRTLARLEEINEQLPLVLEPNLGQIEDSDIRFFSRTGGAAFVFRTDGISIRLDNRSPRGETQPLQMQLQFMGASSGSDIVGLQRMESRSHYLTGNVAENWHTDIPNYAAVQYSQLYPGVDLVFYGNRKDVEYDFMVSPGADPSKIRMRFEGVDALELDKKGNLRLRVGSGRLKLDRPTIYQDRDGTIELVSGGYQLLPANQVGFSLGQYDPDLPLVIDPVLEYSTYLGGESTDLGKTLAVDTGGNTYVAGHTIFSNGLFRDFPLVDPLNEEGSEAFLTKFNAAGEVVFSTFIGGVGGDQIAGVAVDAASNVYLFGSTSSIDFPTVDAFQPTRNGIGDSFIMKLNPDGNQILMSTYFGGSSGEFFSDELAGGITVDDSGNVYVTGTTWSNDFPTKNAFQPTGDTPTPVKPDAWVAKFDASGDLVYSTYLAGNDIDHPRAIAADATGNTYVVGGTNSPNFPLANALRNSFDESAGVPDVFGRTRTSEGFVSKIGPAGGPLLNSTFFGGSGGDEMVTDIAVGDSGNIYLFGYTNSEDFAEVNPPEGLSGAGLDLFVSELNPAGDSVLFATRIGGSGQELAGGMAMGPEGEIHFVGTSMSLDYPLHNPVNGVLGGSTDVVATALNTDTQQLLYSTYLGSGSNFELGADIDVDDSGTAHITGRADAGFFGYFRRDFPTTPNAFQTTAGSDAFLTRIAPSPGQFLTSPSSEPWCRFARLDTNANGRPDSQDEIVTIMRNGDTLAFQSGHYGSVSTTLSDRQGAGGPFQKVTVVNSIQPGFRGLARGSPNPVATLTTAVELTAFDGARATALSIKQDRLSAKDASVRTKNGNARVIDDDADGVYDAITGSGDGIPQVTISIHRIDVNGDGRADFVTIPWTLAQFFGTDLEDARADPQVFIPLGDTNGDGIPDTPAFDFDNNGVADADFPLGAFLSGPDEPVQYKLYFAQFGDGEGLLNSDILLFNLDNNMPATAKVLLKDDAGNPLSVDLNGTIANGEANVVIPACGLRVLRTDGLGPLVTGSVTVCSDKPLGGLIVFGGSVGVAGVGSSEEMGTGFAGILETNAAEQTNTGIALMNLEMVALPFTIRLIDAQGIEVARTEELLPAMGHIAKFAGEFFPAVDFSSFLGSIEVTSNGRITATMIQTRPGEFVTLPVVSLTGGTNANFFAQFGDGQGLLFSQIMILNLGESQASVFLFIRDDTGAPVTVDLNGEEVTGGLSPFIPPRGLLVLKTDGEGDLVTGSVNVTAGLPAGFDRLAGLVQFGGAVGVAGVGRSVILPKGFFAPMERRVALGLNTGIAFVNPGFGGLTIRASLFDSDGTLLATAELSLVALGHRALFVDEFQWQEEPGVALDLNDFIGLIKVETIGGVGATVIQTRPGQLATMPVVANSN